MATSVLADLPIRTATDINVLQRPLQLAFNLPPAAQLPKGAEGIEFTRQRLNSNGLHRAGRG
jgi:hypothetical protein